MAFPRKARRGFQDIGNILHGEGIDLESLARHNPSKPMQILVCGLLRTGKSSLINSLICDRRVREYDPVEIPDPFLPGTKSINRIEIIVQGISIIFWDTPGLPYYFDEIYTKCDEIDAILFCMDMTVPRWTLDTIEVTKQLTERSEEFWRKAILVLTKSNLVTIPPGYRGQERQYLKRRYDIFVEKFRTQLMEQGVSQEMTDHVPAVTAGYSDPASDPQDFLPEMWRACLERISRSSRAVHDILHREGIDLMSLQRTNSSKPMQILVCGLLSTGKSALINSLICDRRAREYDPADWNTVDPLLPVTEEIYKIEIIVQGISIIFWDTPGLQSGPNMERYIDEIGTKCDEVDAILFCMDMTGARWPQDSIAMTRQLTERGSEELWSKAILVLTKTNLVTVPPSQRGEERQYFKRRYEAFVKTFRTQLTKQGVSQEIADRVPAVAAGYNDPAGELGTRQLWYISTEAKDSSDPQDFLPEMWRACLERISRSSRAVHDILHREGINLKSLARHNPSKPMQILVCGLLRTGKSSLINSLICDRRVREYDPAEISDPFLPGTDTINQIEIIVQGISIIFWDTPGLPYYFDEIYTKCDEVDAILFCMDMTIPRWTLDTIEVTKQLTERGEEIWRKAILVLTKTNLVTLPPGHRGQERQYLKRRYDIFVEKFRTQLTEQGVSREIAGRVLAVAAGYSDPQDFIPEIWRACLEMVNRTS